MPSAISRVSISLDELVFLVGHVNVHWQFEDGVVRHVFVGLGMVYMMGSGMDAIDSYLFDIVCKRCLASWGFGFSFAHWFWGVIHVFGEFKRFGLAHE